MPRKPKSITDQLRDAILKAEASGTTRGEIARGVGVSVTAITKILEGSDPRLSTAQSIASTIGYQLKLTQGK